MASQKEPIHPVPGYSYGIELRTHLAAQFVAAEISTFEDSNYVKWKEDVADRAVEMADALIARLNKTDK